MYKLLALPCSGWDARRPNQVTVFVIIAVAAMLAGPASAPGLTAAVPGGPATVSGAAASMPLSAPAVGFRTYADAASCEQAAAALATPAGGRLVCVPVEAPAGEMASAY